MDDRIAWVAVPPEDEVRAHMQPGSPYDFGFVPGMTRLLLAHDEIGQLFRALFARIMFGPGALPRREREMVAAVASAAQDCHY